MTTNRRIIVEAAFGHTPFTEPDPGDWVELVRPDGRTRAKDASWSTGRDSELDPHPAGTAQLILWNRDRELDPDNPASTWAGELVPLVPVRIRSQDLTTLAFDDEFCGYALGWDPVLSPKLIGDVKVELIDLLGVIGGYRLRGVLEAAVLALDPVGFWPLTETQGERVGDLGSGQNDGDVLGGARLGQDPLAPGLGDSAEFDGVNGSVSVTRSPILTDVFPSTVMAVFNTQVPANAGSDHPIFVQLDGNAFAFSQQLRMYVNSSGRLCWSYLLPGFIGDSGEDLADVADGTTHIAFGVAAGLGAPNNGVFVDRATAGIDTGGAATEEVSAGVAIGGTPFASHPGYTDNQFEGRIGYVAIWDTDLALADLADLLAAYEGLAGFRTDEQIDWALDQLGVPASMRNFDDGAVLMGAADTAGREAIEWIREVVDTEQGEFYCDHRDGGKLRFRNRYARFLDTTSTVSQATFTDAEDADHEVDICYTDDGLSIAGASRDGVINQVTVAWVGGEVVAEDAASVAAYGPRPRQINTAATTASQALSVAEWTLQRYREPRTRIRGVTPARRTTNSRHEAVQALEIGHRVTFQVTPLHVGAETEVDLFIDGIDHTVHGIDWVTSFRLAPADTFTPWIWGTSEWGVDALWG